MWINREGGVWSGGLRSGLRTAFTAVSNSGLVFQVADPQAAHGLDDQKVELVGVGAAAGPGDLFAAVDGVALRVLFDEGVVAGLLYPARDFIQRVIPGDVLPVGGPGAAHLRFQQAPIVEDLLLEGGALRAESPPVDGMVGITLDVDHLRRDVLGLVAQRVDDDAATHRAIRTCRARFGRSGDLQLAKLGVSGPQVKSKNSCCRATEVCNLQEISTVGFLS
jgi:hypothetical protein